MKKVTLITMLICTPIAYIWGFLHCQMGAKSGWIFPPGSWFRIEFGGMILEDWLFYPITGFFFVMVIMTDPIKWLYNKWLYIAPLNTVLRELCKMFTIIMLGVFIVVGYYIFGKSGQLTALAFGIPALICCAYIYDTWDMGHFYRTGLIVVPMEFIWDHIAVGVFNQWVYLEDAGIWCDLWWNGIPVEMSPYLGFMSWHFIFGMVKTIEKVTNNLAK